MLCNLFLSWLLYGEWIRGDKNGTCQPWCPVMPALSRKFSSKFCYSVCAQVLVRMDTYMHASWGGGTCLNLFRGQLCRVGISLLPLHEFQGTSSGPQTYKANSFTRWALVRHCNCSEILQLQLIECLVKANWSISETNRLVTKNSSYSWSS